MISSSLKRTGRLHLIHKSFRPGSNIFLLLLNSSSLLLSSTTSISAYSYHASSLLPRPIQLNAKRYYSSKDIMDVVANNNNNSNDSFLSPLLPYETGSHNSIHIYISDQATYNNDANNNNDSKSKTNEKSDSFASRLTATVEAAKVMGKASVWVHVPIHRSSLIESMTTAPNQDPSSSNLNFQFHHAEGTMASLFLWLKEKEACKVPSFATHHVGVGAWVVNSRDEILVVREKSNRNYLPWKIPGGLAELGENIEDCAIREVEEETGIPCIFHSILGIRHTHKVQFGSRSDLFFVCRLSPVESSSSQGTIIPEPKPQEGEISATKWLPMNEYKAMIDIHNNSTPGGGHPMMYHLMKVYEQDKTAGKYDVQRTLVDSVVPGRLPSPIYHAPIRSE